MSVPQKRDRPPMTSRTAAAAAVAALALLAACGGSRRSYQDRNMDFGAIRTIAVLPFQNLTREPSAADRVRDVFATSLLSTGAVYVLPTGEVLRGLERAGIGRAYSPTAEEVVKLGGLLKAEAVITGVVKEYGEVRSGSATSNVVSVSVQLVEAGTGKVVWSAASTKGGIGLGTRIFGGGGAPLNDVTEDAVNDLLDQLFD
jgi:hypothetical protein